MQNMDFELGVGGNTASFKSVKVNNAKIEQDVNGQKMKVLNTEGGFIVSEKINDDWVNKIYAKEFSGVILLSRASLKEKYEEGMSNSWYSTEFNPLNVEEIITVFRGREKIGHGTYQELKQQYSAVNQKGQQVNGFQYFINLYVLVNGGTDKEEIIKLQIKGTSRSNFFNYSKGFKFREAETIFQSVMDSTRENPYYYMTFSTGKAVDKKEMDKRAFELLTLKNSKKNDRLLESGQPALPLPPDQSPPPITYINNSTQNYEPDHGQHDYQ